MRFKYFSIRKFGPPPFFQENFSTIFRDANGALITTFMQMREKLAKPVAIAAPPVQEMFESQRTRF